MIILKRNIYKQLILSFVLSLSYDYYFNNVIHWWPGKRIIVFKTCYIYINIYITFDFGNLEANVNNWIS